MAKADTTRDFIIQKTASIFNKKGYAGTSLTDLTAATGLTKGALYGNFKNKDEIALAAYDYNVRFTKADFFLKPLTGQSPLSTLLAIPEFYKKQYPKIASHGGCPIMNAAVESDDNLPLLKQRVVHTIGSWKKSLENIIQQGIESGEIREDILPAQYASIFIALFEGGLMLAKATDDLRFLHDALDRMRYMIDNELKK